MCFKYVVCIALWSLLKKINEKLYKIHLECAYKWPTTWQMVQTAIDNNIQLQMEKQYANLNKKTGQPNQETNRKPHNETRRRQQPIPYKNRKSHKQQVQQRRNPTNQIRHEIQHRKTTTTYIINLIDETERAIRLLDTNMQNTYRSLATKKLKEIINTPGLTNVMHKRQAYVLKTIRQSWTQKMR